ncbi:MAG: preprotein translocase subunit SecG [Dehalococcoidia bacterium]
MDTVVSVIMIVLAISLITILLMQVRGSGTALFGQAESTFRSRRGVERLLFRATILLAGVFVVIAILNVRLS